MKEKPRSYLYKIGVNLYRDMLRRDKRNQADRHVDYDDEQMGSSLYSPEIQSSTRQRLEMVKNAIRELPPQSRQIILLHRFRNLTCEEIAKDLEIPLRSAQRYLNRVKE